jgi:hypothetical protein
MEGFGAQRKRGPRVQLHSHGSANVMQFQTCKSQIEGNPTSDPWLSPLTDL